MLFLAGALAACESQAPKQPEEGVVARAYDNYLLLSSIEGLKPGMHPADSINLVHNAVDHWLVEQLVYEQARMQLSPQELADIDRKVSEYQKELYTFAYEREVVQQKMDTTLADSAIMAYYDRYLSEYLLQEPHLRFVYVKCDKPGLVREVEGWMRDSVDLYNLEDFCSEELQVCHLYPERWVSLTRFSERMGDLDPDMAKVRSGDAYLKIKQENIHYLIRILEFKDAGQPAPVTFVRKEISSILLNRRKKEFLNAFHRELISSETVRGNVKIYKP